MGFSGRVTVVGERLHIVEIGAGDTHGLRRRLLRDNWTESDVAFPEDTAPGALHLGVMDDEDALMAVGSFSPQATPHRAGWRAAKLRGMAVEPTVQRSGVGRLLIDAAVDRLRAEGFEVIWANGRDSALGFYRRLGWEVAGEGFLNENGIPHHVVVTEL